jgi:polyamine oxidase
MNNKSLSMKASPAIHSIMSLWNSNMDYKGAYSFLKPGGKPEDRDALGSEIAPNLILAGEYTWSASPGTLHAAYLSGERAGQIISKLKKNMSLPIVVIGAGLAGLAAARKLAAEGFSVILLEADTRIGGRAASDSSLGTALPLGGAWLHGTEGHPLNDHVSSIPWQWDKSNTFLIGHGKINAQRAQRISKKLEYIEKQLNAQIKLPSANDISIAHGLSKIDMSHLEQDHIDETVLQSWLRFEYECFIGAPLNKLSTRYRLEPYHLPPKDERQIIYGLEEMLIKLASNLDIRFQKRVQKLIRDENNHWEITCEDGNSLLASAVICATPVTALKDNITIEPPLSNEVHTKLNHIGMGPITKVFFTFEHVFWKPYSHFLITDIASPLFELFVDVSVLAKQPALCAFATGANAFKVESMNERERCNAADIILSEIWPLSNDA